jgi:hypothetical protein
MHGPNRHQSFEQGYVPVDRHADNKRRLEAYATSTGPEEKTVLVIFQTRAKQIVNETSVFTTCKIHMSVFLLLYWEKLDAASPALTEIKPIVHRQVPAQL